MGISLSVAFQKKLPEHGSLGSDHTDLGDDMEQLDLLLKKAKLTELNTFLSADPDEMAEMYDLDADDPALEPEQWFEPAVGLAAVRAAVGYLESNPKALAKVRVAVLDDLKDVEQELILAEVERVPFHFCLLD